MSFWRPEVSMVTPYALMVLMLVATWTLCFTEGKRDELPRSDLLTKCCEKHNISASEFVNTGFHNAQQITRPFKCTVRCLMENGGIIDKNGKFNAEALKKRFGFVDPKVMAKAIESCSKIPVDPDPCEYAYKIRRTLVTLKAHADDGYA